MMAYARLSVYFVQLLLPLQMLTAGESSITGLLKSRPTFMFNGHNLGNETLCTYHASQTDDKVPAAKYFSMKG